MRWSKILDNARIHIKGEDIRTHWMEILHIVGILILAIAAVFVGLKLFIWIITWIKFAFAWYFPSGSSLSITERKDLVQGVASVIQALAVFGGLIGLYLTWRSSERQLQVAREGQERTQESAQETLRLTQQGQITERFTRAIEQLGATDNEGKNKRLEIRLGGIYALERIATDSPERDYSTVMQVLMAYVRENAPLDSKKDANRNQENRKDSQPAESGGPDSNVRPEPPADIQAILDVLRRLKQLEKEVPVLNEQPIKIDLNGSNLPSADLSGADLSGADLSGANLSGAQLWSANLSGAKLSGAKLLGANLVAADLSGANLSGAHFPGSNISTAHFPGFKGHPMLAKLSGADLSGANLMRVNLSGADLSGANLSGAFLSGADIPGFKGLLLLAILSGADLSGANLSGANLKKVDLSEAKGLTDEQLESARGDTDTKLPKGRRRPESWIKGKNEPTNHNDQS